MKSEDVKQMVMDILLERYDWHVRLTTGDTYSDYTCGRADAFGQAILDMAEAFDGKSHAKPYKYEALKRVMHYTTTEDYIRDHPEPVSLVGKVEA